MRKIDGQEPCEVAAKLRITATLLGCTSQKELCAAFRRVNPKTEFDLDRSYKWMQGRTLPRSSRIYEEWARVLRLERSGAWIAACALEDFVGEVGVRHKVEGGELLRQAGVTHDAMSISVSRRAPPDVRLDEDYICGAYACYSHAQSRYHRGRIIRSALVIERAPRRSEAPVARLSQMLAGGVAHSKGPVLRGTGRALTLALTTGSSGVPPAVLQLLLPTPPGSLLTGLLTSFAMMDPSGQPPYASRIAIVRVPCVVTAVEATNRYMESEPMPFARDLVTLGLDVADAAALDALLDRFLRAPREHGLGMERITMADHVALASACDRIWLDTVATRAARLTAAIADRGGSPAVSARADDAPR
ncbi:hypothetical protein JYK14_14735 [Siccirubricoccus sp. KC 17139]|uniref:Uncharacterized protein n=1 Tax=Siccirubricoccus soli TaxID=2899147 RepID=A0ABT1D654_9PROT|nr:hypothetical protein [Siccirubricoccus soli]MCO6417410.1 hypothetical protein [Siccirubricoccus soli]MCP2683545.1 hypothetical protein [Siccirubricoccus soli]